MSKSADGYSNILWNVFEPFSSAKQFQGSAQYIIQETLVSQLVRTVMGLKRQWVKSAEIHTYSVPLIGSVNFGDDFESPAAKGTKINVGNVIGDGVKSMPAAALAYIAQNMRENGFVLTGIFNRDFLALLMGKIASRGVLEVIHSSLPQNIADANAVLKALWNKQRVVSEKSRRR